MRPLLAHRAGVPGPRCPHPALGSAGAWLWQVGKRWLRSGTLAPTSPAGPFFCGDLMEVSWPQPAVPASTEGLQEERDGPRRPLSWGVEGGGSAGQGLVPWLALGTGAEGTGLLCPGGRVVVVLWGAGHPSFPPRRHGVGPAGSERPHSCTACCSVAGRPASSGGPSGHTHSHMSGRRSGREAAAPWLLGAGKWKQMWEVL